ncbi:MAG: acyl-CoA dehydrogenase family protein [Dehalococcoidia bacterium]|nr:acyl-CoA dehydrogenase family protein [Dehalococcoidia bacterium]
MDFNLSPEHAAFQQEVRDFIQNDMPAGWNTADAEDRPDIERQIRFKLAERKWLALAWPKEYGGLAASPMQQMVYNEMMAYNAVPSFSMGVAWVGPVIMLYGTKEQQERFLPRITSGEDVWCTLYSEPGSGSDLASLQARAVRDGDDYVVNGQKIWTSGGHRSDWGWLAVRTDPDVPKHKGISMVCVKMDSPGITVRPLVNMAGTHEFNEVFFEDVRIPVSNLVGEENRGWYSLAVGLDFERSSIGATSTARRMVEQIVGLAKAKPGGLDHGVKGRLVDVAIAVQVMRNMGYKIAAEQERTGIAPNRESQMAKLFGAELNQRIATLGLQVLGMQGQATTSGSVADRLHYNFLRAVANTIEGGTSEIQRNVIATRALGLPRE